MTSTTTRRTDFMAAHKMQNRQQATHLVSGICCARRHVRQVEIDLRPSASYLSTSTGNDRILPIMRGILVSWLTEVAMQFDLRQESLFLASSLLDRYLSKRPVRGIFATAFIAPHGVFEVQTPCGSNYSPRHRTPLGMYFRWWERAAS